MAFVHALPHIEGELVGRHDLLERVRGRLREGQPTLLVGPPGVGKTALAIRAAEQLTQGELPLFEGGTVTSRAQLEAALACCPIGAPDAPMSERPVVVLDGLDRMVEPAWAHLVAWLARTSTRVILTCRAAPSVAHDLSLVVPLLATPSIRAPAAEVLTSPAVELLLDHGRGPEIARLRAISAGRRAADAGLTERVATLVRALDGLPLSLKLAASKLEFVSMSRLLGDLDGGTDPLRPARNTERGLDHLLRAACDDVSALSRVTLRACAVFAGPFDIDAAQHVVGDDAQATLHALYELVRAGLVSRHGHDDNLLVMLNIVRVFALRDTQADAHEAALDRREAMLLHRIGDLSTADLRGRNERLRRLFNAADDLWGAAARALSSSRVDESLRLLGPAILARIGRVPGAIDRALVAAALDRAPQAAAANVAFVHVAMAELERTLNNVERAVDHAERAVATARHSGARPILHTAYAVLGACLALTDRTDDRLATLRLAAELARSDLDIAQEALMHANIAMLLAERGEVDQAVAMCLSALEMARASEARLIIATVCEYLGYFEVIRGRTTAARAWIAEAHLAHASFEPHRRHLVLRGLVAECDELDGDIRAAMQGFSEVADNFLAVADPRMEAMYRCLLSRAHLQFGDREQAHAALATAVAKRSSWDTELRALVPFTAMFLALSDGDAPLVSARAAEVAPERPLDQWMRQVAELVVSWSSVTAMLEADRTEVRGRATEVLRALVAIGRPNSPAIKQLSSHITRTMRDMDRVWVAIDGAYVVAATGERTALPATSPVRAILALLVERLQQSPGEPISRDALFAAGWPSERTSEKSASNRVYVALSSIRKAGLADQLLRQANGWLLRPTGNVLVVKTDANEHPRGSD